MLTVSKIDSPIQISKGRVPRPIQLVVPYRRRNAGLPFFSVQAGCIALDAFAIIFAILAGCGLSQLMIFGRFEAGEYLAIGITGALLFVLTSHVAGAYQTSSILSGSCEFAAVFRKWLAVFAIVLMTDVLFNGGSAFSGVGAAWSALLALGLLLAAHWTQRKSIGLALQSGFVQGQRVIVVGYEDELATLNPTLLLREFGITEVFRIALGASSSSSLVITPAEAGAINDALEKARDQQAAGIVLALSWADTEKLELLRNRLRESPLPVILLPDRMIRSLTGHSTTKINPNLAIGIQRGSSTRASRISRRFLDILGGSTTLWLCSPLICSAAAIE